MNSVAVPPVQRLKPDGFKMARILAIQPEMRVEDLTDGVLDTEDPIIIQHLMENLVQLWAVTRRDLPQDFLDHLQVLRVQRQPLMFTSIAVQHISRRLTDSYEPSDGKDVDQKRWSSQDLLKLTPVKTMEFPDSLIDLAERLPGQEEIRVCSECKGAKAHECTDCGSAGELTCPTCDGNKQRACPACNGAGSVLGVSGRMIQCRACNTRGTVKCIDCNTNGMVPCDTCAGEGTITCKVCTGLGQEKRYWTLHTIMQTRHWRHARLQDPWPIDAESLWEDSRIVLETEWEWPVTKGLDRQLAKSLPAKVATTIQAALVNLLVSKPVPEAKTAADTGLRLRILGSYLYRVEFDYHGFKGTLFVGGDSNRIFAYQLPTPELGFSKRLGRWVMRVGAMLDPNLRPQVDHTYIKAVQSGKSHISDSLCLGLELADTHGVEVTVTPAGYRFILPHEARISWTHDPVPMEVAFEVDDRQALVLAMSHHLGPAHRDVFPKALALNHKLRFGRIAVTRSNDGSEEIFLFVDRRPYASLRTDQYFVILREIECAIGEVLAAGILS